MPEKLPVYGSEGVLKVAEHRVCQSIHGTAWRGSDIGFETQTLIQSDTKTHCGE